MAAINHSRRRNQQRRRERLEHLERLERLEHLVQCRRERLEHLVHLERLGRLEHLEHLRQKKSRRGISGYILAKRIYPKSMKAGVDYEIKVIELQIDSADFHLPFYEEVPDQDFGISSDHSSS